MLNALEMPFNTVCMESDGWQIPNVPHNVVVAC